MENLSHSLPKKSYRSNGFAGNTVYDDVFGGPPKFGVPTLSPRVEDYSEIFEGFHASRGSSIPILDLPAVDDDADVFFDVRSSEFDYSEVFGGFNGLDFAVSYEELFKQSTRGDDSSDEAWTPAQSESLSDESDPSACSEKNQSLSYGDLHHSSDGTKQFNISYHKAMPKGKEDMLNGVTHVTQLDAIPGYSFIVNETLRAQKIEDENSHLRINQNTDFGGGITEGKRLRKTVSQPPNSDFGVQEYESESNPLAGHDKASSPQKAFISVTDISLRTQPSHLPPPSRPPPAFTDRKGNSSRLNSKLKASKSYAFERVESDSSPPYFDVEIDASSSAAASAAAMKNAVEKAQAQLRSAKELMERKKEGLLSRTKLHLENDLEHSEEKTSKFDRFNSCKGERVQSACERESNEMRTYAAGQRKKVRNTTHVASGATDGEDHIDIAGKSALNDQGKEHTSSQVSHKTEGTVAWREETQFYEVVKPTKVKDKKTLEQHSKSHDCGPKEKSTGGVLEQQEYKKRTKAARVDHEWEENGEHFEGLKGVGEQVEKKGRRIAAKGSTMQEEYHEKANLAQKVSEWQEEKKTRVSPELGETEKRLNELDICEDCKILTEDQLEANEVISEQKLKGVHERVKRIKKARERKGCGREIKETFDSEEYERELKEDVERVGNGRKLKKALELGAKEEREKEVCGGEEIEKKSEEAYEIGQKREKWEEALGPSGKAKRSKEVIEQEDSGNSLQVDLKPQENKKEKYWAFEEERNEKNEKNSKVALEQEKNAKKQEKAYEVEESEKKLINDCERDETENRLKEAWKQEENNIRPREAHESDESEKGAEVLFKEDGTEDRSKETNERVDCNNRVKDDNNCNGFSGLNNAHEQIKREENDRNLNQGIYASIEHQKTSNGACNLGETDSPQAIRVASHYKIHGNLETIKAPLCEENGRLRTEPKNCEREMEDVEGKIELIEGRFDSYGMDPSDLQHEKTNTKTKDSNESLCLHDSVAKSNEDGDDIGGIHVDKSKGVSEMASDTENAYIVTHNHREGRKNINGVQIAFGQGENRDKFASSHVVREWVQHGRKVGDVLPAQKLDSQCPERKETNFNEKLTLEEREKEERLKRERDLEDDRLRKIEEEKEREREREKDRMAVDTATREARERTLAEARDRAERAAVERATAEVRQRVLAEARERLEKASAEARERLTAEKVLTETRLKAEHATMERATSEARERAFEKAMVGKASFVAHERMERSVSDNFSAYSRNGGLRQSSSSTNLQDLQYGVGSSRDLKYSYSSVGGLEGESAQRCKARLERHQRTAERAAKALAEKNMRDLLAHKEQAERNRLAESLDADVKRWSSGKEGNLRALLSTLQYILGHDSGWKPIPLTDVITAIAVKKAYRKATLFVHPDKLQQRGASIQQKYICEKVFDLLKEAWNKFNSEER